MTSHRNSAKPNEWRSHDEAEGFGMTDKGQGSIICAVPFSYPPAPLNILPL